MDSQRNALANTGRLARVGGTLRRAFAQIARDALIAMAVVVPQTVLADAPLIPEPECAAPVCSAGELVESLDLVPTAECDESPCEDDPYCVCDEMHEACDEGHTFDDGYDAGLGVYGGTGVASGDGTSQSEYGGCVYAGEVYVFGAGATDEDCYLSEPNWDYYDIVTLTPSVQNGTIVYSTACDCSSVYYVRVDEDATTLTFSVSFADQECGVDDPDPTLSLYFDVVCRKPVIQVDEPLCNENPEDCTIVSVRSKLPHSQGDPAVRWELRENEEKCELIELPREKEDPNACDAWYIYRAKLTKGCEPGDGKVKVYAETAAGCCDEVPAEICCKECDGPDCGAGAESARNNSVDFRVNLGQGARGEAVGSLRIYGELPSAELSSPGGLRYDFERSDVTVTKDSNGDIARIEAPEVVVEIAGWDPNEPNDPNYSIEVSIPGAANPFVTYEVENLGGGDYDTLEITKKQGGDVRTIYTYAFAEETNGSSWTLQQEDPNSVVVRTETVEWEMDDPNDPNSSWTRTRTVAHPQDSSGDYSKIVEEYEWFTWGIALTERKVDPDGDDLVVQYGYDANEPHLVRYVLDHSDGSWRYYAHYDSGSHIGLLQSVISSWGDAVLDPNSLPPSASANRELIYEYDPNDPNEHRPIRETEKIEGTETRLTEYVYTFADPNDPNTAPVVIEQRCLNPTAGAGSREFFETTTTYDPNDTDRIAKIEYPDGRADEYTYETGTYTAGTPGSFTATADPNDTDECITITHLGAGASAPEPIAGKSTKERIITDLVGRRLQEETYPYESGGWNSDKIQWKTYEYDPNRPDHLVEAHYSDSTYEEKEWEDCCGITATTGRFGEETLYERDGLGRVTKQTRVGIGDPNDPNLVTEYDYAISGGLRQVTTTISPHGSADSLVSVRKYDLAGRIVYEEDHADLVTEYEHDTAAGGGRLVTVTRPDGSTEITEYYRDGRVKSVSGTGVIHRYYEYAKEADGDQTTTEYIGCGDDPNSLSDRWVKTTYDPLGRVKQEERPPSDAGDPDVVTYYTYDDTGSGKTGRLIKTEIKADSTYIEAPTVYEYDELGNLVCSGLDLNNDGDLNKSGTDRISETETLYVESSGDWWLQTKTYAYVTDNDPNSTKTSEQRQRLTGFGANEIAETESVDVFDNVTTVTTTLDRSAKTVTETTDYHATDNDATKITRNGLLQSTTDKAQITTTFGYDGFGRRTTVTDGRGNTTTTAYNSTGQVDYVEDEAGNRITYEYDTAANGGRLIAVKSANDKHTRYDYSNRGEITHVWGDVPQPVFMRYDDFGQRVQLSTFRDSSVGWSGSTWPGGVDPNDTGDADITTWTYDEATGLLEAKTYADGKSVTYTYTPDGKLETRTWARDSGGITTTYDYADGSTGSGDLEKIDYSDSTTDVEFTYTRTGQIETVTDAVGQRTFAYEANHKWQTEEFDPNSLLPGVQVRQGFNSIVFYAEGMMQLSASFLRLASIQVGTSADPDADYEAEYHYGADTDRMTRVNGPGLPGNGANYTYLADSHLLWKTRYQDGATYTARIVRTYEDDRDLLTSVKNKWTNSTTVSHYTYANDDLGRREWVYRDGTAFAGDHADVWGYNDRNELTDSDRYNTFDPNNPGSPSDPNHAFDRAYCYDPIGNREWSKEGADPNTAYTVNNLNQYTATQAPSESFTYDDDGNLTADGTFSYIWDAENRLTCVQSGDPNSPANGDKKVEFVYDYMGRRAEKKVSTHDGASWSVSDCRRFAWSNWLPVLEYDVTDPGDPNEALTIIRKYTWGLDLAGTGVSPVIDGAGGIGGLLATEDVANTQDYYYLYDANGNVGQLLDASDGSIAAKYEYDAYGNNLLDPSNPNQSGPYAADNPFRFSTKYWDDETGLGFWGYRYYSPRLARWLARDPLEAGDNVHPYLYVANRPTGSIDVLGQYALVLDRPITCTVDDTISESVILDDAPHLPGYPDCPDHHQPPPRQQIRPYPGFFWPLSRDCPTREYEYPPDSSWATIVPRTHAARAMRSEVWDNIDRAIRSQCRACHDKYRSIESSTFYYELERQTSGWVWWHVGTLYLRATAACNIEYHCTVCTACCSVTFEYWDGWHWRIPGSCGTFKDFNWSATKYEVNLLSAGCW